MPAPKDPIKYREWKDNLSKSNKGKSKSEEWKKKLSEWQIGKKRPPFSDEWKNNIGKAQIGRHHSEVTKKKMSKWQIGRKLSDKTRKKMSDAQKGRLSSFKGKRHTEETKKILSKLRKGKYCGEKSSNWKGGITPKNLKIRNSIEMNLWREAVFARDNFTDQKTGIKGGKLHAHHIQNFAQYPELRTSIENGITFSKESHKQFHKRYGIKNNNEEQIIEFLSNKL